MKIFQNDQKSQRSAIHLCPLALAFVVACWAPGWAFAADKLPTVVKISAEDRAAVVETVEGDKRLVKVGEQLAGYMVTVIDEGRMVLEMVGPRGPEWVVLTQSDGREHPLRITKTVYDAPEYGVSVFRGPAER